MATGHNNKIVGQAGEYLVAAELGRWEHIANQSVPKYFVPREFHYNFVEGSTDER